MKVRALSVCANTRTGRIRENAAHLVDLVHEFANDQPVDIVVMSEVATTGFIDTNMFPYAETTDSETAASLF